MVKEKALARSRAFLTEFIIVLLFFSIALGIIVRVFAGAHQVREKANNLTIAMTKVQSLAEYAKAAKDAKAYKQQLQQLGGIKKEGQDNYVFYYNKAWVLEQDELKGVYKIEIQLRSEVYKAGELMTLFLSSSKTNIKKSTQLEMQQICELQASKYYPNINYEE